MFTTLLSLWPLLPPRMNFKNTCLTSPLHGEVCSLQKKITLLLSCQIKEVTRTLHFWKYQQVFSVLAEIMVSLKKEN